MFKIFICFLLMLSIANSKLLQVPEDTEAAVGQNQVVLKCGTDITSSAYPVEWHHTVNKDAAFEIVYKRGLILNGYRGRLQVIPNTTTGQYDLIIRGVKLEDAGAYTCMDRAQQHKAELIVFEKYPSKAFCKTNSPTEGFLGSNNCGLEPDTVKMSCDLSYRGNLVPILEWMYGDNVMPSNNTKDASGVTRSFIERRADQHQTSTYTCHIKYHESTIASSFTWSSTVNITSLKNTTNLSNGGCDLESLNCSDVVNGECSYTWYSENGTELTRNAAVILADKRDGNYTCLATCNVRQMPCSYVAKTINYQCNHHSDPSKATKVSQRTWPLEIQITAGILLVVVTIAMLILAFLIRRVLCKGRRGLRNSNDSDAKESQSETSQADYPKDETSLKEPLVSSTENLEANQINILNSGATMIKETPEKKQASD